MLNFYIDGTPCAVKVACTVWSGGKSGEHSKDYLSLLISALLEAIPEYIEVTTGMAIPQQNTGPLINTVSRFILQLWYNAEQSESEKLQRTIDSLLKAITLKADRS